ncbi:MAG: acireductone dioxygenase [Thiotrichales bacterium]
MSELRVYPAATAANPETLMDHAAIQQRLQQIGVRFERWAANKPLTATSTQAEVIDAYRDDVERLMRENGFQSVDVISVTPDHPEKAALRQKFLAEHTHSEYEVRFFVDGQGLFYLHVGDQVYTVLCEKGDLISVPAGTTHWFDMGPNPSLKAIRLFTKPEGWVANFTGSTIAERFPRLEN